MSKIKTLAIIALIVLLAIASIGCDGPSDTETVLKACETVTEVGTVHSMLKGLADQDYAQPNSR